MTSAQTNASMPRMPRWQQSLLRGWYRLKLAWPIARVQRHPVMTPFLALVAGDTSLEVVDELVMQLLPTRAYGQVVTYLKQDPACAALIRDRYMAPPYDLDALLHYPPESLGYHYATYMQARGFRAEDLYQDLDIVSDADYVEARLSQTHDIWHVVTGFQETVLDEIGLQAFHLPQFSYPLAAALIASSLMTTLLYDPEQLPSLLTRIHQGWEMGLRSRSLFAQRWEDAWEKPLATWRAELGIQPVPAIA